MSNRLKLVYPSYQAVIKRWLDRIQRAPNVESASLNVRSSNRRVFAEGFVIYSYGTHFPLARWIPKRKCFILNVDKHSPSTSRHQAHVRHWVNLYVDCIGFKAFGVESSQHGIRPADVFDGSYNDNAWLPEFDSLKCIERYHNKLRELSNKAKRSRKYREFYYKDAMNTITQRNRFIEVFQDVLERREIQLPEDVEASLVLLKLTEA